MIDINSASISLQVVDNFHHAMHVFNKTVEEYVFRVKLANMCMYNFRFLTPFPVFGTSTITIHQEETCIRIHGLKV